MRANGCVDIVGHMTGAADEATNERVSQQRADAVRTRLVATAPALSDRSFAQGVGSRQTMIGFGSDDAKDALDRRVGLLLRGC